MTIGNRIRQGRLAQGMTQGKLAELLEVSPQAVNQWEKDRTSPGAARLVQIQTLLGVDLLDDATAEPRELGGLRGQRVTPASIIRSDDIVDYSQKLNVYASAQGGDGKIIIGTDIIDRVPMPAVLRDVPNAYGLLIDGESMQPEYWPGDIAWVHPHLKPARTKNHILFHTPDLGQDAEAIIKRVNGWNDREWDLEQWNPHKKFKEFRKEWPVCHRVVGKYDAS